MRRILAVVVTLFFLVGCAATLTRVDKDGSSLSLSNYAYTELVYDNSGKLIGKNIMIPSSNIIEGVLKTLVEAISSFLEYVNILGDQDKMKDAAPDINKKGVR